MAKINKNGFTEIVLTWEGANVDSTQYKPYNPRLIVQGIVQIKVNVPNKYVEEVTGSGKTRIVTLTPNGVVWCCKKIATAYMQVEAQFPN